MGLREVLSHSGMTQMQIAKKLDVSQQLISCWVNGQCTPTPKMVARIAKVLDITVEEVLNCFEEVENEAKEK